MYEQVRFVPISDNSLYNYYLGPNELSIVDADNLPALLAPDMPRGPSMWNILLSPVWLYQIEFWLSQYIALVWDGRKNPDGPSSLISSRSSKEHSQKRIPWNHAFNTASIREYQVTITNRAQQLIGELKKRAERREDLNIVTWLSYFALVYFCLIGLTALTLVFI